MRIQHQMATPGQHYVTLPGQSPVYVGDSTTNRAFDQYAQKYNNQHQYGSQPQYTNQPQHSNQQAVAPTQYNTQPMPQEQTSVSSSSTQSSNAGWLHQPSVDENQGAMDYTVEIVNTTRSRLFIEATDAAGNIIPCGFAPPKKRFSINFKDAMPMQSPILVVLRDPDQDDAPELRRYRIATPTSSYNGKTLKINVISGGRYQALVDDEVYYENNPND